MADVKVNVPGTGSGHLDYPVPGGSEFILKQAFAKYNGGGAASAWYPAVQLIGPDGNVAGEYITGSTVAAGGSADVTFAPFLKGAAAGLATASLPWCIALSATKNVTSGAVTTTTFDFAGGLTTNDASVYELQANGDGTTTPYIIADGVYLTYILGQLSIGASAPAAGSAAVIESGSYGNEPIGNPAVASFYVDPVTALGRCKPVWLWMLGVGVGLTPPIGGAIGLRQNSGTTASCSMTFAAVRLDPTATDIL